MTTTQQPLTVDDFWVNDEYTGPKYWSDVVLNEDGTYVQLLYKWGDLEDSFACRLGPYLPDGCYS